MSIGVTEFSFLPTERIGEDKASVLIFQNKRLHFLFNRTVIELYDIKYTNMLIIRTFSQYRHMS